MNRPATKEEVLALLRVIRSRAALVQNEVDFLGIAVRDELMTPSAAQAFIELYGLDYMHLATIEASRRSYYSGNDAELGELMDAEDRQQTRPTREPFTKPGGDNVS